jgi:hypothetical protein
MVKSKTDTQPHALSPGKEVNSIDGDQLRHTDRAASRERS